MIVLIQSFKLKIKVQTQETKTFRNQANTNYQVMSNNQIAISFISFILILAYKGFGIPLNSSPPPFGELNFVEDVAIPEHCNTVLSRASFSIQRTKVIIPFYLLTWSS